MAEQLVGRAVDAPTRLERWAARRPCAAEARDRLESLYRERQADVRVSAGLLRWVPP